MKRIQEKVKDLVEVRHYKRLQDFIAEPSQTLAGYHFTDFTSDLMAKYLDKITAVAAENGAAAALAGYRGVGKSHFLATLGAIAAHPELRSSISDRHVAASIERLKRARYPVAYVRRGTHPTLLEEIKAAIAKTFETDAASLGNSLNELLEFAAGKAGDATFLLLIDTAFERVSRVARDDGILLGEAAEAAKKLNVFAAVALDDDISGADGINAAISRSFTIDYLDQEHLYKIVDAHLFPKNRQTQPLIHDIYTNFREVLPHFRWSEQRFSALYPLHPIILEIAPFVRLYAPEFALLGFASDAAAKILARPANSLIALDEVFDQTENSFRKAEELREAFAAYDNINKNFIAQIPVMQRLQAKLVLKALFLLSLEGEGATAGEIGAAMLIYDEIEPARAVKAVEDLLANFAVAYPAEIDCLAAEGREVRYSLKIDSKDNLNSALAEAVKIVSPAVIPKILRRAAREKFSDWIFADESDAQNPADAIDCDIIWRGSRRRGRLCWDLENKSAADEQTGDSETSDWQVITSRSPPIYAAQDYNNNAATETAKIYWQPAPIRPDEAAAILRYYVLLSDENLREEYGEQTRAAAHAHLSTIEKIWNRVFLHDAKFTCDGFEYKLSDEARTAENLSDFLSKMLAPVFDVRFPHHPHFLQTLTKTEVSALIGDFFSGARSNLSQTQQLAETFALPLGLVALNGGVYVTESEEHLADSTLTGEILALVRANAVATISLKTVYQKLKQSPYGLIHEAQHLILTALVAQRQIEFVTTHGDRINRRSLDLKIIWDDIEGISKPSSVVYSNERLTEWARILTGSDVLRSIDAAEEKTLVRQELENWLTDWQTSRVLARFDELPDEILNTRIWRLANYAQKTFGVVSAIISAVSDESISLEEGLHRVADAFSDSEREFYSRTKDLVVLEDFINGVAARERIWNYLAVCENTRDEKTEFFREKLAAAVRQSYEMPNETLNREMENLWQSFHARFSEHFSLKHDMVMKSHHLQEKFDEILRSDEWWEFENLSRLDVFQPIHRQRTQMVLRQLKELDCRFDVREMLKTHPFCACSFNLTKIREWENLPAALEAAVNEGRKSFMKSLRQWSEILIPQTESFSANDREGEFAEAARSLIDVLAGERERDEPLTNRQLVILQKAFEDLPNARLPAAEFQLNL